MTPPASLVRGAYHREWNKANIALCNLWFVVRKNFLHTLGSLSELDEEKD